MSKSALEERDPISMWLQAAITALVGVIIYVVGRIIERGFLEPLNEQRRLISDIAASLIMLADQFMNTVGDISKLPPDGRQALIDAHLTLRRHAAELDARNRMIPWYGLWVFLRLGPNRKKIHEASRSLIGLSNGTPPRDLSDIRSNDELRNSIQRLLGLMQERNKA